MTQALQKSSISDGMGLSVDLLNYGARICSINFHGSQLALGLDKIEDYLDDGGYLGASIGPITNRIANGQLNVNGELLQMPLNLGEHTLHSGGQGFDKQVWRLEAHSPNQICYSLDYDMTQVGLKGCLTTKAIYRVTDGCLSVKYRSICDTICFINITNHVYLNLSYEGDISDHRFQLNADSLLVVDSDNIPTGELKILSKPFEHQLDRCSNTEFDRLCDHHFNVGEAEMETVQEMLSAISHDTGISLTVSSNSPGFQFYTGQFLAAPFSPLDGFCVETQLAPDAINHPALFSPLLLPNQQREQITHYQFCRTQTA
ncbi:MAG: aldose 1-epimerase [Arenicella sp.]|jgi:aldose 1-epimerase